MANAELREWKKKAHAVFDPLWRAREMRRSDAYKWLAGELGIAVAECHIGMFDVEMCGKVVEVVSAAICKFKE